MIHHNIHLVYDATMGGSHPPASCYDGLKMTIVTKPAELEHGIIHKSILFYAASQCGDLMGVFVWLFSNNHTNTLIKSPHCEGHSFYIPMAMKHHEIESKTC
jgi:hypothetical protein